jgi:hypothetical protein
LKEWVLVLCAQDQLPCASDEHRSANAGVLVKDKIAAAAAATAPLAQKGAIFSPLSTAFLLD